ncbi:MAG TPA: DUF3048 domain-containing protein [Actinomycetota bacterium]
MALSRRGKVVAGIGAGAVAIAGAIGVLALTGHADKVPIIGDIVDKPATCPLTGLRSGSGDPPDRPALAVKVENLPEARPQAGLQAADVVYEEPVEGGITRFIVLFQCHDAKRVGPVRSARFTDVDILPQFGSQTLFGFAGGAPPVEKRIQESRLNDVNFQAPSAEKAYTRDPNRDAPHDLYTSTQGLYRSGGTDGGGPEDVFGFSKSVPSAAKRARSVHLDFSPTADVTWTYSPKRGVWVRSYDTGPAELEGGSVISATNVVVQVSKIRATGITDAAGNASPEVVTTGKGDLYVFRNGRVVRGTWSRASLVDTIEYRDAMGHVIDLAPGTTWIELLPDDVAVDIAK